MFTPRQIRHPPSDHRRGLVPRKLYSAVQRSYPDMSGPFQRRKLFHGGNLNYRMPPRARRKPKYRPPGSWRKSGQLKRGQRITYKPNSSVPIPREVKKSDQVGELLPWTVEPLPDNQYRPHPLLTFVPDGFQHWYHGFGVNHVAGGTQVSIKNIGCRLILKAPGNSTLTQPFNFRIIQGFVKMGFKKNLDSTHPGSSTGSNLFPEGIVLNYARNAMVDEHVEPILKDYIGNISGTMNMGGAVYSSQIQVLSDQTTQMKYDTEMNSTASATIQARQQIIRHYEWNMKNKRTKLYPVTQASTVPRDNPDGLVPINDSRPLIPFLVVMLTNNAAFGDDGTNGSGLPQIGFSSSTYWTE